MGREEREAGHDAAHGAAIEHIVNVGRQTRKAPPRWLWIVAIVVGALGAGGFAAAILAEPEASASHTVRAADERITRAGWRGGGAGDRLVPADRILSGVGSGLLIGIAVGLVIGYALARQRVAHSSRSSP